MSTNRFEGAKYDGNLDTAEIAKRIKVDIKAAIAAGTLPKMKVSVTISRFSGGSSISVNLSEVPGFIYNPERLRMDRDEPHTFTREPIHTPEAAAILDAVKAIVNAYNHDGSDIQSDYFDVKFYEHVEFGWKWAGERRAFELACLPPADRAETLPPPAAPSTIPAAAPANDSRPRVTLRAIATEECPASWAHIPGAECCLCAN